VDPGTAHPARIRECPGDGRRTVPHSARRVPPLLAALPSPAGLGPPRAHPSSRAVRALPGSPPARRAPRAAHSTLQVGGPRARGQHRCGTPRTRAAAMAILPLAMHKRPPAVLRHIHRSGCGDSQEACRGRARPSRSATCPSPTRWQRVVGARRPLPWAKCLRRQRECREQEGRANPDRTSRGKMAVRGVGIPPDWGATHTVAAAGRPTHA